MNMICLVGNKLFTKLNIGKHIDKFNKIIRCNMSLPMGHNGTKFGELSLCNHLYEDFITLKRSTEEFKERHQEYNDEDMNHFTKNFNPDNFESVYISPILGTEYNKFLTELGCPHTFAKQPRTGFIELMRKVMSGEKIAVSHFTINNKEERNSWYVKLGKGDSECHHATSEINILRWLHKNNLVDASLCLLKDEKELVFYDEENELEPTEFMLEFIQ